MTHRLTLLAAATLALAACQTAAPANGPPMVGKSTAAAAILIWRVVTYYFYLLVGGPVFVLMLGKPLLKKLMNVRQAS